MFIYVDLIKDLLKHSSKKCNISIGQSKSMNKQLSNAYKNKNLNRETYIISVLMLSKLYKLSIKVIYLTNLDDIFIIGGLVDRTVIKNASLNRAL
jgi:hypothetical protein